MHVLQQGVRPRDIALTNQQAQGHFVQVSVTVAAHQLALAEHGAVHAAKALGHAALGHRVAVETGLITHLAHVVGVPAVHRAAEIDHARSALGAQRRVGVAALAQGRIAGLGLGQQVGALVMVVNFQDICRGLIADPRVILARAAAVAAPAVGLGGYRGHNFG